MGGKKTAARYTKPFQRVPDHSHIHIQTFAKDIQAIEKTFYLDTDCTTTINYIHQKAPRCTVVGNKSAPANKIHDQHQAMTW